MILYITGSFPRLGDGIGDAAGHLYQELRNLETVHLVTTDRPQIQSYIQSEEIAPVLFVSNWKTETICRILRYARANHISKILVEYCGNGYGRDLAISYFPFMVRLGNIIHREKTICHLRLHEYTMCSLPRKIFTIPLVLGCHHLDTPSYTEFLYLSKRFGRKVYKSAIGSNIDWLTEEESVQKRKGICKKSRTRIRLGYFGGIYPGKGIEALLEVWERLEQDSPGEYEYVIVGGIPEGLTRTFDRYWKKIQKMIREKGLENKILFSGFLPEGEVEKELDRIDIAVLPYEDGLTLRRGSFLAFLARGKAIVTVEGDEEARSLFRNAKGVRMCGGIDEMLGTIREWKEAGIYMDIGADNLNFRNALEWNRIAKDVLHCFQGKGGAR